MINQNLNVHQHTANVAALKQAAQNKFIETRTIIDSEVTQFIKSVETLVNDLPDSCKVLVGKTTKDVLPSLWVEPFNKEQYLVEKQTIDSIYSVVEQVVNSINEEAYRCLQQ